MSELSKIPYNRASAVGDEFRCIEEAIANGHLSGDGPFTRRCREWLEARLGCAKVLLTHSCTAGLEMAALLADLEPGDEVIMPSFTFVSTANAVVLRGAVPVFVDIRPDTLNLDEEQVAAAITHRTRAIMAVHYAGVGAELDALRETADAHRLLLIEDAAQGILATYKGRPLGSRGHLSAISFHETKNVTCGEGGALVVNDPAFAERAETIWSKGTNRRQFLQGQVDKYTWVDVGSSYALSEISAAFLWAQLGAAERVTQRRLEIWDRYHHRFEAAEARGSLRRPMVPEHCRHNAHIYYLLLRDLEARNRLIAALNAEAINAVFHYVPLHTSPAGRKYGRAHGALPITESTSECLVRLPLWYGMHDAEVDRVAEAVYHALDGMEAR